jgi:hypothetical protein
MKKIILIVLFTIVLLLIAACGNASDTNNNRVEVAGTPEQTASPPPESTSVPSLPPAPEAESGEGENGALQYVSETADGEPNARDGQTIFRDIMLQGIIVDGVPVIINQSLEELLDIGFSFPDDVPRIARNNEEGALVSPQGTMLVASVCHLENIDRITVTADDYRSISSINIPAELDWNITQRDVMDLFSDYYQSNRIRYTGQRAASVTQNRFDGETEMIEEIRVSPHQANHIPRTTRYMNLYFHFEGNGSETLNAITIAISH